MVTDSRHDAAVGDRLIKVASDVDESVVLCLHPILRLTCGVKLVVGSNAPGAQARVEILGQCLVVKTVRLACAQNARAQDRVWRVRARV